MIRPAFLLSLLLAGPVAGQPPREAGLPAAEWRALNVFFSNFAEAGVEPFARGALTDEVKIRFGLLHTLINAPQRVERAGGTNERIAAAHVDAAAVKYFGSGIGRLRSLPGYRLAGRHYVFPGADGEGRSFAHVARWAPAGDEFSADVSLFVGEDVDGDVYGVPVEALRRGGMSVRALGTMRARVRRVREGGHSRYVLLEWLPAR